MSHGEVVPKLEKCSGFSMVRFLAKKKEAANAVADVICKIENFMRAFQSFIERLK